MYHSLVDVNFSGYSLLIPSVSVGNVGQLSADLLISSLECRKAGYINHDAVLPLVGANAYEINSTSLAIGVEVYFSEEQKLTILQLRSSLNKSQGKDFLEEVAKWVKANGIIQVIVLTGSSNEERIDEQIVGEPFRYVMCSHSATKLSSTFSELGWTSLERRLQFPALSTLERVEESSGGKLVIPGGGFAKRLYTICCQNDIPSVVLIKFCSEGDNIPDAMLMVNKLNTWLHVMKEDDKGTVPWKFPPSWRHLFGNPPPKQLY